MARIGDLNNALKDVLPRNTTFTFMVKPNDEENHVMDDKAIEQWVQKGIEDSKGKNIDYLIFFDTKDTYENDTVKVVHVHYYDDKNGKNGNVDTFALARQIEKSFHTLRCTVW